MDEVAVPRLNKQSARRLTDRIVKTAGDLWELLLAAHDGRAWEALGYQTWDSYVAAEFPISKSQSYRLLDQGRAIHELSAAAGISPGGEPVVVSERAARELKPVIGAVAEEVRRRTKGRRSDETRRQAAGAVVDEAREAARPAAGGQAQQAADLIPRLVKLNPRDVAAAIPVADRREQTEKLRRWADAVADEARGFGKTGRDSAAAAGNCTHPVGRRIGSTCMACGKDVGGAK